MPANGRWDLIRRLMVNATNADMQLGPLHSSPISEATWNPQYSAHTSSYTVYT